MGRTIKLILYYFAYQFAVAIPGMFGYTIWKCFETQSFDLHNAPTSLAIILSLLGTLLMAWHLIHYKYVKLDKQTLASLPLKPTCLYILMGAAAIIWMNWLSEMVHLPNIAENVFAQMKNNVFGILSVSSLLYLKKSFSVVPSKDTCCANGRIPVGPSLCQPLSSD